METEFETPGEEAKSSYHGIKSRLKPKTFDYGQVVAMQTSRVMEYGSRANHPADVELFIDSINCLESLLCGFWMGDTKPGRHYRRTIALLNDEEDETTQDRKRLAHYKLRALMELQRDSGFQSEYRGMVRM